MLDVDTLASEVAVSDGWFDHHRLVVMDFRVQVRETRSYGLCQHKEGVYIDGCGLEVVKQGAPFVVLTN